MLRNSKRIKRFRNRRPLVGQYKIKMTNKETLAMIVTSSLILILRNIRMTSIAKFKLMNLPQPQNLPRFQILNMVLQILIILKGQQPNTNTKGQFLPP